MEEQYSTAKQIVTCKIDDFHNLITRVMKISKDSRDIKSTASIWLLLVLIIMFACRLTKIRYIGTLST